MFPQTTSDPTPSATSSPASADGASPSDSRDGLTLDLFGQEVAPASRSASPAKEQVLPTNGIYGRIGSVSSGSESLASSLAKTLMQQLDGAGSTLFSQTWKRRVTPRGRQFWAHTASARRTSDSDCGSWPTPMAGTPAQKGYHEAGNNDSSRKTVDLCSWPTPTARDGRSEYGTSEMMERRANRPEGKPLSKQVLLAGWTTPRANKWGEPDSHGTTVLGSPAQTEKRGQLNPAFSLWLMGYPPEWLSCAPQGTQSSRKPPPPSSELR
jgi:hypothetical protein